MVEKGTGEYDWTQQDKTKQDDLLNSAQFYLT